MKTRILFFACALLLSGAARAQDDLTVCHMFTSDVARLGCYDRASGYQNSGRSTSESKENPAQKSPATAISPIISKWTLSSNKSAIDDSTNVHMSLTSDDRFLNQYGESGPARLFINCRENTTRLYITFNGHFMSDLQTGTVTYRLDDAPARKRAMRESNDNSALGLWSGGASIPFIKQMFGHEKMLIRATPFSESAITVTFDISGLKDKITPLRKSCNW